MYIEQMDLSTYPIKAHSSPEGMRYTEGPRPATNNWRINYENKNGFSKWIIWGAEQGSACAELPVSEIRILEKRMETPTKILSVQFGAVYKQREPGGEWINDNPKDPRVCLWIEKDFTEKYMNDWRVRAYDGQYDPFNLSRGFTVDKIDRAKIEQLENKVRQLEETNQALLFKNNNLIKENNDLIAQAKAAKKQAK